MIHAENARYKGVPQLQLTVGYFLIGPAGADRCRSEHRAGNDFFTDLSNIAGSVTFKSGVPV